MCAIVDLADPQVPHEDREEDHHETSSPHSAEFGLAAGIDLGIVLDLLGNFVAAAIGDFVTASVRFDDGVGFFGRGGVGGLFALSKLGYLLLCCCPFRPKSALIRSTHSTKSYASIETYCGFLDLLFERVTETIVTENRTGERI